jgi:hypothetical protein
MHRKYKYAKKTTAFLSYVVEVKMKPKIKDPTYLYSG